MRVLVSEGSQFGATETGRPLLQTCPHRGGATWTKSEPVSRCKQIPLCARGSDQDGLKVGPTCPDHLERRWSWETSCNTLTSVGDGVSLTGRSDRGYNNSCRDVSPLNIETSTTRNNNIQYLHTRHLHCARIGGCTLHELVKMTFVATRWILHGPTFPAVQSGVSVLCMILMRIIRDSRQHKHEESMGFLPSSTLACGHC